MTQCTKQFDPLKPCRRRNGEKIINLGIDLTRGQLICALGGLDSCTFHESCGHWDPLHADHERDLVNVEEDCKEFDAEEVKKKFRDINNSLNFVNEKVGELKKLLGIEI